MLYPVVHLTRAGFEHTTLVVIDTDYTDSCKSNYHTIMTTTNYYLERDYECFKGCFVFNATTIKINIMLKFGTVPKTWYLLF
jgi:hypothetical protein